MKIILTLLSLTLMTTAYAKTVARVLDIGGNAFVFTDKVSSYSLKQGSKIPDLSEVMVEDGSTLSIVNSKGHTFHINGGSLVKFYDGLVELKNGHIWVNNKQKERGVLHSSNSIAKYSEGQFIYSFDNHTGKTQLLVLTGGVQFSNSLEPSLSVAVPSGSFSLIDQSYEKGLPRSPTKVGLSSYKKMRGTFAGFNSLKGVNFDGMWSKKKTRARSIASVNDQFSGNYKKTGRVIKIRTIEGGRLPASASPSAMNWYKETEKAHKVEAAKRAKKKRVKVNYIGFSSKVKDVAVAAPREPASLGKKPSVFEDSLKKNINKNQRHSDEINRLIDELKSYKQDFTKHY